MSNLSVISVELFLLTNESFVFNKGISVVEEICQEILVIEVNTSDKTQMIVFF